MTEITKHTSEKSLTTILPKQSGRNNTGQITSRHSGGRQKRFYREIDFRRDKHGIPGRIVSIEYDPNRNVTICLVHYQDGEKRYILSPLGVKIGDRIVSGVSVETHLGNALALKNMPIGTPVHNVELHPGKGGQMVRGAGTAAYILSCEGGFVHLKLPSSEIRMVKDSCFATVGQLSNVERKTQILGSAGRARHLGMRPKVRGTAQHPASHPHGGGEGRSGEGMHPKTRWGKPARGLKTRNKHKYSNRYIVQRKK